VGRAKEVQTGAIASSIAKLIKSKGVLLKASIVTSELSQKRIVMLLEAFRWCPTG
jgi:hypothetical protein